MCVSSFCTTLRCIVYIACNLPPSQFDLLPLELELSHLFPCPCLMPMAAKNAPISRRSKSRVMDQLSCIIRGIAKKHSSKNKSYFHLLPFLLKIRKIFDNVLNHQG